MGGGTGGGSRRQRDADDAWVGECLLRAVRDDMADAIADLYPARPRIRLTEPALAV